MSTHRDSQTFSLFERAALEGERYGYPHRLTVVDPAMAGSDSHAWDALSSGGSVLMHTDGVEILIEPEPRSLLDRWLRRVPVTVSHRSADTPRDTPSPVRLHQRVSRGSVFEYRSLTSAA